ncbi:PREDICTED: putative E3 ubiquitin-protein ligase RING1a [Tarenaya hassleriana]|uniref:putative E3 ubiquitin-protein ligase RING1a n=1 Tax=Tarenaya hassleriana TaxID=28532 RepID=UPI00053C22C9|nr:PREDICTED: putative E3 ubiquitin-protein ligase RING1a [Tarenaya hassleriana]
MPTHQRKRLRDADGVEDRPRRLEDGENHEDKPEEEDRDDHDDAEAEGSDRSSFSSEGKNKEFVMVNLSEIHKDVQCPICLGIIRKTRTVMECLHRFCRECIDKSMRLGNNECPACRTHCASRRSLRDDKNFDALIAYLYPDINKYEEEELAFSEVDKARSKEIQATIAKAVKRQSEAIVKKRSSKKTAVTESLRKSRHNLRVNSVRGRRNLQRDDTSNDDDDDNGERDSSSGDDRSKDVRPRRRSKRARRVCSSQPSGSNSSDRSSEGNSSERVKESKGRVRKLLGSSEGLAWGKGGARSHPRHGNGSGGNGNARNGHNNRVPKVVDHLQSLNNQENEMNVHIMLVSMDEKKIPNLQKPYLSCRQSLTAKSLCRYIALQNAAQANEIEIYVAAKELSSKSMAVDPSKDELRILNKEENLGGLKMYGYNRGYVVLAYQKKGSYDNET